MVSHKISLLFSYNCGILNIKLTVLIIQLTCITKGGFIIWTIER